MTVDPNEAMIFFRQVHREVSMYSNFREINKCHNLRDYAKAMNIDLDECMGIVKKIVEENKYNAGGHMYCTRENVLTKYQKTGEVVEDIDHIEGLGVLIAIDLGYLRDR
jgi:DNA polymerase III alpha subunit